MVILDNEMRCSFTGGSRMGKSKSGYCLEIQRNELWQEGCWFKFLHTVKGNHVVHCSSIYRTVGYLLHTMPTHSRYYNRCECVAVYCLKRTCAIKRLGNWNNKDQNPFATLIEEFGWLRFVWVKLLLHFLKACL